LMLPRNLKASVCEYLTTTKDRSKKSKSTSCGGSVETTEIELVN